MRKGLKYIFILCLCIILGGIIGFVCSNIDLINNLMVVQIKPLMLIALFLLASFVSTGIHEMMHAIYFILNHMKLRYMSIFVFCLYKSNKHYKFAINISNISLFSGIVIPEIPVINSKGEFKRVQRVYSEALLAAPLLSLLESLLLIITLFLINKTLYTESPELFYFIIFNIFISGIIFISSFAKTESVYGDFSAFRIYRFDDKFAANQIMQYMFFNATWEKDILESKWLIEHVVKHCRYINSDKITMVDVDMLDLLLTLYRMDFVNIDNDLVDLLARIFDSEVLFSLPSYENRNSFFYHLMYFLYSTKKYDKVYLIDKYETNKEKIRFANKNVEEYYENLTKHIIFKEDKFEWLINNIFPNSMHNFLKIFESVQRTEICLINQNGLGETI